MSLHKAYKFESMRLKFRGIEERDAEIIVRWRSNPANYRYFFDSHVLTMEEHCKWFAGYLEDESRYDFIIENASGLPIGTCGLSYITKECCEISYMIGELSERSKGYATEALRSLTDVAFRELGVKHIDARILPDNEASTKVALEGGYSEVEKVFRIMRDN